MPPCLGSDGGSLSGLQMAAFLLCLIWWRERASSFSGALISYYKDHILMISSKPNNLQRPRLQIASHLGGGEGRAIIYEFQKDTNI